MAGRRVFIVWSSPLFFESVRLLLNHPDVEMVGASGNIEAARQEIDDVRPDTIIFEKDNGAESHFKKALELLENSPWGARILSMSLQDNQLAVYYREQCTMTHADDLVNLVLRTKGDEES